MTNVHIDIRDLAGVVVATPTGRLDLASYPVLRDSLLKQASTEPDALIVRLGSDFEIPSRAMYAVFTAVWIKISPWPDIPFLLVAESETHQRELTRGGVSRFVATCQDIESAFEAAERPPPRRFHRMLLPNSPTAPLMARAAVRDACAQWQVSSMINDAVLVASELVENAVAHAHSESSLRIELRRGGLSIAVRDRDPEPATLVPSQPHAPGFRGLELVDRVTVAWGSTPSTDGGKIVWAVLPTFADE